MARSEVALQSTSVQLRYDVDADGERYEVWATWKPASEGVSQGWQIAPRLQVAWPAVVGDYVFVPGANDAPPDSAVRRMVRALQEHRAAVEEADAALLDVVSSLITPEA